MSELFRSTGVFILYLLANPLWYIGFLMFYVISGQRVKSEREAFHTRVYARRADWTIPLIPAVIAGISLSLLTAGIGTVVTVEFIAIIVCLYVLLLLTCQMRWVTPTFVFGVMLLIYGSERFLGKIDLLAPVYEVLNVIPIYVIASLLAIFVIVEGFLILTNGATYSSPQLKKSKRGKWIGSHLTKRLWVVPVLFFVPEGLIPGGAFWPVFSIGDGGWQPVLLPFLIGFKQQVKATLPAMPIRLMGSRVIAIGLLFALIALSSYFVPVLAVVLGGLAIFSRELLTALAHDRDRSQPPLFTSKPTGSIILGILPNSPAEKMNLKIGDAIMKVNGQTIVGEGSFYDALQLNSAYCKLDVINSDGQLYFVKGALFDGEHHQLGVLLVKEDVVLQNSII